MAGAGTCTPWFIGHSSEGQQRQASLAMAIFANVESVFEGSEKDIPEICVECDSKIPQTSDSPTHSARWTSRFAKIYATSVIKRAEAVHTPWWWWWIGFQDICTTSAPQRLVALPVYGSSPRGGLEEFAKPTILHYAKVSESSCDWLEICYKTRVAKGQG